jgi:orotidine-5'-phosphate decarboxylase
MGKDSLYPFLDYKSKLNFILALTSNPGANDFEKLMLADNAFLYQDVIKKVRVWNKNRNCGLVFGATKKEELLNDITSFDELPVLLPGVGAQGGSLEEIVSIFKQFKRTNFLINISRGIIYRSTENDFADKARTELVKLNNIASSIMK